MNLKAQLKLYHILVAIKQNCRKQGVELHEKWYHFDNFLNWAQENGFDLNEKNFCGEQKFFYKNRLLSLGAAF